ncbi:MULTISPECIES: hypothetical protein [unclassified Neptuniibacter]|uniref:hypothetical protein n=1 Tax=unclassified Neptuniibacter TaxID=2630693 RepID=UPI000C37510A|nr:MULTISPECIES: hypothetical protein [unclassified Neptuniibacter]MAY43136.1 hypothetical protein [Oceanospirillaceae bacterium]|tara:strand:- start:23978 stop:24226 length:249 start_codon:yes stop_codon:yes gene_type:complete
MSSIDKKEIRSDKWMNLLIKTGIPVAIVSIISLWVGWYFKMPALGNVFIVTAAIALTLGMIYNVRFVILSVRQIKAKQAKDK